MNTQKKVSVIGVILVLVIGGFFVGQKYFPAKFQVGKQEAMLLDIDRGLTPEQKKIYEDKIVKANDYLKTLVSTKQNFVQEQSNTYVFLAQQYSGLGSMQKARELYNQALANDFYNEQALVGLSSVYIEAKDLQSALQALDKTLQHNTKNPDIWLRYIQLKTSMGDSIQNLNSLYEQALEKTSRQVNILTKDAAFQEQQGNVSGAIVLWKEAAKGAPENSVLYQQEISRLQKMIK